MNHKYIDVIQRTSPESLLTLPHLHIGAKPTGFVVKTEEQIPPFQFTVCPLLFCKSNEEFPGMNPHDVLLEYTKDQGDLEELLYKLWELYSEKHLSQTKVSMKRYIFTKKLSPRKIIIPCLGRRENLIPTLIRLQMIDLPSEGYKPIVCLVEHSPHPDLQDIAIKFGCEYFWLFLDPLHPELPIGQFNKALCYDKAFLFGSPAEWYLFHDNDVLVPSDFWVRIDRNVERANTKFLQPYTGRSLMNTLPGIAETLRLNLSLVDLGLTEEMIYPRIPGAPGGSLYLKRERYIEVGGHDPNICWGYGPEDTLFFTKLKQIEPIAYADEPPIEMIHLWHPTAQNNNPFRHEMDWFVKFYYESKTREEKIEFFKGKRLLLEYILQELQKSDYMCLDE
jgi:hypothetical protein